jgi:hypothetical protein
MCLHLFLHFHVYLNSECQAGSVPPAGNIRYMFNSMSDSAAVAALIFLRSHPQLECTRKFSPCLLIFQDIPPLSDAGWNTFTRIVIYTGHCSKRTAPMLGTVSRSLRCLHVRPVLLEARRLGASPSLSLPRHRIPLAL